MRVLVGYAVTIRRHLALLDGRVVHIRLPEALGQHAQRSLAEGRLEHQLLHALRVAEVTTLAAPRLRVGARRITGDGRSLDSWLHVLVLTLLDHAQV